MRALTAQVAYTPLTAIPQPVLLMEEGRIAAIHGRSQRGIPSGCEVLDLGDSILAPGFVDLHIHGGAGHDVMDANSDSLPGIERLLARHGVTTYFPTTMTASEDEMLAALDRLAQAIAKAEHGGAHGDGARARPAGVHVEGPFLSHARRGVHPPQQLRRPSLPLFERFWQAAQGRIRMMTIAPELEGAQEVIAEATKRGVCVSLGHSDAGADTAKRAVGAGARHATHTFNAMRPLGHRDPGLLGVILAEPAISADIIADGIHVDPEVVRLFLHAKGPDHSVLISDATSATGMPDGRYRLGPLEVEVRDGKCTCDGKLAGSVLTLDRAVRNVVEFAGWPLRQAVRSATFNPARVAGLSGQRGVLVPGADADIVALSPAGEVRQTFVRGVPAWNSHRG
jgi:N-acetylglucosamine-6-phosphate deacetylase